MLASISLCAWQGRARCLTVFCALFLCQSLSLLGRSICPCCFLCPSASFLCLVCLSSVCLFVLFCLPPSSLSSFSFLLLFGIQMSNIGIYINSRVHPSVRPGVRPSCVAKTSTLDTIPTLRDETLVYPPCLQAPLTSAIVYNFHLLCLWPQGQRKAKPLGFIFSHLSTDHDEFWYGVEAS